jgi:hypothetical protein
MRNLVMAFANGQFACMLGQPLVSLLPLAIELLWLASAVGPSAESLLLKGTSAFGSLIGSREANGREERKAILVISATGWMAIGIGTKPTKFTPPLRWTTGEHSVYAGLVPPEEW